MKQVGGTPRGPRGARAQKYVQVSRRTLQTAIDTMAKIHIRRGRTNAALADPRTFNMAAVHEMISQEEKFGLSFHCTLGTVDPMRINVWGGLAAAVTDSAFQAVPPRMFKAGISDMLCDFANDGMAAFETYKPIEPDGSDTPLYGPYGISRGPRTVNMGEGPQWPTVRVDRCNRKAVSVHPDLVCLFEVALSAKNVSPRRIQACHEAAKRLLAAPSAPLVVFHAGNQREMASLLRKLTHLLDGLTEPRSVATVDRVMYARLKKLPEDVARNMHALVNTGLVNDNIVDAAVNSTINPFTGTRDIEAQLPVTYEVCRHSARAAEWSRYHEHIGGLVKDLERELTKADGARAAHKKEGATMRGGAARRQVRRKQYREKAETELVDLTTAVPRKRAPAPAARSKETDPDSVYPFAKEGRSGMIANGNAHEGGDDDDDDEPSSDGVAEDDGFVVDDDSEESTGAGDKCFPGDDPRQLELAMSRHGMLTKDEKEQLDNGEDIGEEENDEEEENEGGGSEDDYEEDGFVEQVKEEEGDPEYNVSESDLDEGDSDESDYDDEMHPDDEEIVSAVVEEETPTVAKDDAPPTKRPKASEEAAAKRPAGAPEAGHGQQKHPPGPLSRQHSMHRPRKAIKRSMFAGNGRGDAPQTTASASSSSANGGRAH